jgi:hypothetical protein
MFENGCTTLPLLGPIIAVLIPTSSPRRLSEAPAELAGLIGERRDFLMDYYVMQRNVNLIREASITSSNKI